jgi:drug/metabolite transporter (DMT)-like permease
MSFSAFLLIFFSAILHVAWNMASKNTNPSVAFYALMSAVATIIWSPFFFLFEFQLCALPWQFAVFLVLSIAGEVLYVFGLAHAYRRDDISLVYPMMRALPVLLVAGSTCLLRMGEPIGWIAVSGMFLITVGCLLMPLRKWQDFSWRYYLSPVVRFILLGSFGISLYTVCDGGAMQLIRSAAGQSNIMNTFGYLFLIHFGLTVGTLMIVIINKNERSTFKQISCRTLHPVWAGCCSSCSYALVLLAMGYVSNVSYVQAFRQMSLPFGFFAGILILKEKATPQRICGIAFILLGLLCVALG